MRQALTWSIGNLKVRINRLLRRLIWHLRRTFEQLEKKRSLDKVCNVVCMSVQQIAYFSSSAQRVIQQIILMAFRRVQAIQYTALSQF